MTKRFIETYCAAEPDKVRRCVIRGCTRAVVAQLFDLCHSDGLRIFFGIDRPVISSRRRGDEPIYTCQEHLDHDERMAKLLWQLLMPEIAAK